MIRSTSKIGSNNLPSTRALDFDALKKGKVFSGNYSLTVSNFAYYYVEALEDNILLFFNIIGVTPTDFTKRMMAILEIYEVTTKPTGVDIAPSTLSNNFIGFIGEDIPLRIETDLVDPAAFIGLLKEKLSVNISKDQITFSPIGFEQFFLNQGKGLIMKLVNLDMNNSTIIDLNITATKAADFLN